MARDRRLIDVAVEDTMDTRLAVERLKGLLATALTDGRIDPAERIQLLTSLSTLEQLAAAAVSATERANIAELVSASMLRSGGVNRYLRKQAEAAGLPIVMLSPNLPRTHEPALPAPEGEAA